MEISITQASKDWGIPRTSIYDKINSGELSRLNNKKIDTSEMIRVFGTKRRETSGDVQKKPSGDVSDVLQKLENEHLKQRISELEQRERELKDEKQRAEGRVDSLLDQLSKMTDTIRLLEAPKVEPAPKTEEKPKGFFKRIFSREE